MKWPALAGTPPILYGAGLLAALSIAWSTHEITTFVDEGWYGLSAALAGDVGWIAVLRAEHKRTTLLGQQWIAPAVGWVIALGVAALLVTQGVVEGSLAKALAGPVVVLIAKAVWALALAELRDPTELTPEQEAEIASVMRDSEYEARLHAARLDHVDRTADAEIARIRAEARITLARDDADAEIRLERIDKIREIERRSPVMAASAPPALEAPAAPPTKPSKRQPPAVPAGPAGQPVDDVPALFAGAHAPVVYFLRNGTRVKIGTSQNLRRRIASLSLRRDDVIRVEHGDQQYERSLHHRFGDLRAGDTEWFELTGDLAAYLDEPPAQPPGPSPEPSAHTAEPPTPGTALVLASALATPSEPQAPPAPGFGFSAHLSTQQAQRAEAIEKVAELLAQDRGLTSGQVAEALSVSPATAKRYLREARKSA